MRPIKTTRRKSVEYPLIPSIEISPIVGAFFNVFPSVKLARQLSVDPGVDDVQNII